MADSSRPRRVCRRAGYGWFSGKAGACPEFSVPAGEKLLDDVGELVAGDDHAAEQQSGKDGRGADERDLPEGR
jgi:hypothetical protein